MSFKRTVVLGSAGLLALLVGLLVLGPARPPAPGSPASRPLLVYCAAGLKSPVEAAARDYEREFGTPVQLQYGGSGTLLNNLKVSARGDLFVAADSSFVEIGRSNRLLAETLPLARLVPVVVVPKDNPHSIHSLADLLKPGTRIAVANPDAAAVGSLTRKIFTRLGRWNDLTSRTTVFKPTVNDIANDVKLGSVDAGIVWDATAAQYPELAPVHLPEFANAESEVSISVLNACDQPTAALRFARYLAAHDRGLRHFSSQGFRPVDGDAWDPHPRVILYSGSVNRVSIEQTLAEFEKREGVTIERVYNGCGILTAQIRAGQKPDAYFACDVPFMRTVTDHFLPAIEISETRLVLLAQTNLSPRVSSLADLTRPGLRIGIANETQSALGALTARVLDEAGIRQQVMAHVAVQAPTGDLLLNQLRSGGLDVALVYAANASQVANRFTLTPVESSSALAIQPYAVGRVTRHAHLMERLRQALVSTPSRARFEGAGFRWRAPADPDPSPRP